MVTFVTSIIGAAAVFARVASAVPQGYGNGMSMPMPMSSSSAMSPSYTSGSSKMDNSKMMDDSKMMGNSYGSSSSSASMPSYTSSMSMSSYGSGSSKYGSGSSSMSNSGYDSCVQQCVAQYGSPASMNMPPSSTSSGSMGSGATHTVVVAPTKGVFRYVPFAVNASVGDTVKFIWGADEHTVTKSSELALCNKTSDKPFASGEQNQSFVFTQMVNDTNPTFFYCGTPTHCEKGMFGIINPPSVFNNAGSASMMMPSLASQYPSTQAAMSYAANMTANQSSAAMWGGNIDLSSVPSWAQSYAAENIMYTQSFLAMNPETMSSGGSVDLSPLGSNAVMLPTDVAAAARANNEDASTSSSSAGYPAASSTASGSTPSSTAAGDSSKSSTSGAGALSSPRVTVALVAVVAAFFAF